MIKVLFFAQLSDLLGTRSLEVDATEATANAELLRASLAATNETWAKALVADRLLVAVNQTMSRWNTQINDGDEVAFFPPVTGG